MNHLTPLKTQPKPTITSTTASPSWRRLGEVLKEGLARWHRNMVADAERRALRLLSCSTLRDIGLAGQMGCPAAPSRQDPEQGLRR